MLAVLWSRCCPVVAMSLPCSCLASNGVGMLLPGDAMLPCCCPVVAVPLPLSVPRGDPMATPWHCVGTSSPSRCPADAWSLPLRCHAVVAMSLPLHCHAVSMLLPLRCHAVAEPSPRRCRAVAVALPCGCQAVATPLPCGCRVVAVLLPCCRTVALPLQCCCSAVHAVALPSPYWCFVTAASVRPTTATRDGARPGAAPAPFRKLCDWRPNRMPCGCRVGCGLGGSASALRHEGQPRRCGTRFANRSLHVLLRRLVLASVLLMQLVEDVLEVLRHAGGQVLLEERRAAPRDDRHSGPVEHVL